MNIRSIITAAFAQAANEIADAIEAEVAKVAMVDAQDAAKLLSVTPRKVRQLMAEHVELGEATRRYRLSTLQRVIEQRTISRPAAGLTTRHQTQSTDRV
jgi:hypothetical protein